MYENVKNDNELNYVIDNDWVQGALLIVAMETLKLILNYKS